MTSELSSRDPVEVLGEDFLARRRRGENPDIGQYIAAHQEYAEQIGALFPAMIAMEDLKVSKNQSSDRPIRLHVDRLERLGDYRIIREIGHGGMGIVYEAEQQSLHRRVAVKVFPKQAIGDSQQLKRFQREAETVGALHHTNIVPVFGVGEQDGLHYFVMQLLDGVSLDALIHAMTDLSPQFRCEDYLKHVLQRQVDATAVPQPAETDSQPVLSLVGANDTDRDEEAGGGPTVGDATGSAVASAIEPTASPGLGDESGSTRLGPEHLDRNHWRRIAEIGIQVAEALHYAHCRGVMHRDVKPSNVVLGADWRVWITDFGLAVTPEQERLSRSGDVVGTLRYMSPEQLNGRSDARSDVYGLGLTLYELMTLRPAFAGEHRGSLIRKVAKSSPLPPRAIRSDIPKDLETVVLKAIAKSPQSRYRSAAELADDLRRFHSDQPIRARRIGPAERLCRWSRRNPALAGMILTLVFGAAFSFAAVSWNWRQAVQEKRNAEVESARAENNLTLALGSMDRLLKRFQSDWMAHPVANESGSNDSVAVRFVVSDQSAAILEEALEFYDSFAAQNANSPELQRDTAKAYHSAGDILERLGRFDDAEQAFRRCAEILVAQAELPSADFRADPDLIAEAAAALNRLALVLHAVNRSEDAKQPLNRAARLLGRQIARGEYSETCIYELALTNSNLGLVLWRMQQEEESTRRHRHAIVLLEGLAAENPLEAKYRLALARAYRNYYPIAAVCKERVYSNEIRDSAASMLEQLVFDFPNVPDYQCELSEMLTITSKRRQTSPETRSELIGRAVELAERLNREFRSIPRYQTALAKSLSVKASIVRETNPDRASEIHQRATSLLRDLRGQFPYVAAYQTIYADALREQGLTLRQLQRWEESITILEASITQQAAFLKNQPDSVFGRKAMAGNLRVLAETLDASGDAQRASEVRAHANSYWKRRPDSDA